MNYIGSKYKLSNFIRTSVFETVGADLEDKVFCDLFAGTGVVGRSFKTIVKQVIANDLEYYSYALNRNYIGNSEEINSLDYIAELNRLQGKKGFVYNNYCNGSLSGRQYFSDDNGLKIDAARIQIEKWKDSKEINENTYYFLLVSL